jgi:hypothetical protein
LFQHSYMFFTARIRAMLAASISIIFSAIIQVPSLVNAELPPTGKLSATWYLKTFNSKEYPQTACGSTNEQWRYNGQYALAALSENYFGAGAGGGRGGACGICLALTVAGAAGGGSAAYDALSQSSPNLVVMIDDLCPEHGGAPSEDADGSNAEWCIASTSGKNAVGLTIHIDLMVESLPPSWEAQNNKGNLVLDYQVVDCNSGGESVPTAAASGSVASSDASSAGQQDECAEGEEDCECYEDEICDANQIPGDSGSSGDTGSGDAGGIAVGPSSEDMVVSQGGISSPDMGGSQGGDASGGMSSPDMGGSQGGDSSGGMSSPDMGGSQGGMTSPDMGGSQGGDTSGGISSPDIGGSQGVDTSGGIPGMGGNVDGGDSEGSSVEGDTEPGLTGSPGGLSEPGSESSHGGSSGGFAEPSTESEHQGGISQNQDGGTDVPFGSGVGTGGSMNSPTGFGGHNEFGGLPQGSQNGGQFVVAAIGDIKHSTCGVHVDFDDRSQAVAGVVCHIIQNLFINVRACRNLGAAIDADFVFTSRARVVT